MHLVAIHLMHVCCILNQFDELALCKLICLPFQNTCGKVLESRLTTFARFTLFLQRGRILVVKRFQTDDDDADEDNDASESNHSCGEPRTFAPLLKSKVSEMI